MNSSETASNVKITLLFMSPKEVVEACGCKRSKAYKIIRKMNDELKEKGYFTQSGKVQRSFFYSKIYGYKKEQLSDGEKLFLDADDLEKLTGICKNSLYPKIREANHQLDAEGYLTLRGKLPVGYYQNRWVFTAQ